jgi:5-methylcytosine-specific restriction endonuclease McrA
VRRSISKGRWITKERRLGIYIRDSFKCWYCNSDLREVSSEGITLDHVYPKAKGGTNDSSNLITACKACNSSKQDEDWKKGLTEEQIVMIEQQLVRFVNIELAKELIRERKGRIVE